MSPDESSLRQRLALWCVFFLLLTCLLVLQLARGRRVIELQVEFPTQAHATEEPLVVTGVAGRGDFLLVRSTKPHEIQIHYDSWGLGGPSSEPILIVPGRRYLFEIHLPSLTNLIPIGPPPAESELLEVIVDRRTILKQKVHYYPSELSRVYYGRNPFPGTFSSRFTGRIEIRNSPSAAVDYASGFVVLGVLGCLIALFKWRLLHASVPVLACLFPLFLLLDRSGSFYHDWMNHVWFVGWHGPYIAQNLTPPEVMHTPQVAGMVNTVFYGHFFYTVSGAVAAFLGADAAIRLVLFLSLLLQFAEIRTVIRVIGKEEWLANAVSVLSCWAIYPLVNLYQRSSLAEFAAVAMITAALARLVRFAMASRFHQRLHHALALGLYVGPVALIHPITAMLGYLAIGAMGLAVLAVGPSRQLILHLGIAALLIACIVSPWIYVLLSFGPHLRIMSPSGSALIYDEFNGLLVQLSPVPLDPRSVRKGLEVGTPYLNAQVNVPLLIVFLGLATLLIWRRGDLEIPKNQRALGIILIGVGLIVFVSSLAVASFPSIGREVPVILTNAQFAYRYVSSCDWGLLMSCLGWFLVTGRIANSSFKVLIIIAMTTSALGVIQQQIYGRHVKTSYAYWRSIEDLQNLAPSFLGNNDYSLRDCPALPEQVQPDETLAFRPRAGIFSGHLDPQRVVRMTPGWVKTNIAAFPWNRVRVDGQVPSSQNLACVDKFLAIRLEAGEHQLRYEFEPDPAWRTLRSVSWAAFLVAFATILVLRRRGSDEPPVVHSGPPGSR